MVFFHDFNQVHILNIRVKINLSYHLKKMVLFLISTILCLEIISVYSWVYLLDSILTGGRKNEELESYFVVICILSYWDLQHV